MVDIHPELLINPSKDVINKLISEAKEIKKLCNITISDAKQVKSLFDKSISKDKRYFEETKKKLELIRVRDFRNTIEKFEDLKKRVRTIENSITVLERLK
jgi:polyhydroxyalkanoate synthesis regulator phasin